jgi:hypothetical protein
MFPALGHVFSGTEGVGSRFHVLRFRSHFRRYRGYREPCFTRPESFLAVSRASGPVFIFCAPEIDFGVTECVGSHLHVLRTRTHLRQYRGRPIFFSCFLIPDMFSAVPRASGPVFMFCGPEIVFGVTEGVGSNFHVFAPRLIFGGIEGVPSCFDVFRSQTHFRWHRGRWVPFSSFARPTSFSAVPAGSRFHLLRARNHFCRY